MKIVVPRVTDFARVTRWCAAYVRAGAEDAVVESLYIEGFEPYLPRQVETIVTRGAKKERKTLLFPRYVLVGMTGDAPWQRAATRPGVVRLLGPPSGEPWTVRPAEIEFITGECGPTGLHVRKPRAAGPRPEVGELVRVKDGPFTSFDAIVDLPKEDRVTVIVNIFGRRTPVEMRYDQIESIDARREPERTKRRA